MKAEEVSIPTGHAWQRLGSISLSVAVVGAIAFWFTTRGHAEDIPYSWLISFMFFLSLALGSLLFVLALFATNAGWGVVVRRTAENAAATLPVFALLFLPVLLSIGHYYHWAEPAGSADPLLRWEEPYLDTGFFVGGDQCDRA